MNKLVYFAMTIPIYMYVEAVKRIYPIIFSSSDIFSTLVQ